jgi:hypothetical protein
VQEKGEKTVVSLPSSALPVLTGPALEIEIGAAERHREGAFSEQGTKRATALLTWATVVMEGQTRLDCTRSGQVPAVEQAGKRASDGRRCRALSSSSSS